MEKWLSLVEHSVKKKIHGQCGGKKRRVRNRGLCAWVNLDAKRWLSSWKIRSLPQWSRHQMKSGIDVQRSVCDERPVSRVDEDVPSHRRNHPVLRSIKSRVLGVYFRVLLSDEQSAGHSKVLRSDDAVGGSQRSFLFQRSCPLLLLSFFFGQHLFLLPANFRETLPASDYLIDFFYSIVLNIKMIHS